MAGRKTWMGIHAALMTILLTAPAAMAGGNTVIPADKSRVNKWFNDIVNQKSGLDSQLTKAEQGTKVVKVMQNGGGNFKTITDAVKSVPNGNTNRVIIYIGGGTYKEKITIPREKPFITFFGDPKNMPKLTFNGDNKKYGTVYSATLTVESDYFMGVNLNIINSSPRPDPSRTGAQAVALRVSGTKAALYNCKMYGFQDTVCDDKGYHLFKDCYIEGTVDFIFGSGKKSDTYFSPTPQNTDLRVLGDSGMTVITAQARDGKTEDTGYSFVHCNITGTGKGTFLGRAWRASPQVVYAYTAIGDVIAPEGWTDNRHPEYDRSVNFGEYKNRGPGSSMSKRVKFTKQLSDADAKPFISLDFIQGTKWLLPIPNPKV
ncbi:hypothetical protein ACLB2K_074931 [Fragaria x ananassa]